MVEPPDCLYTPPEESLAELAAAVSDSTGNVRCRGAARFRHLDLLVRRQSFDDPRLFIINLAVYHRGSTLLSSTSGISESRPYVRRSSLVGHPVSPLVVETALLRSFSSPSGPSWFYQAPGFSPVVRRKLLDDCTRLSRGLFAFSYAAAVASATSPKRRWNRTRATQNKSTKTVMLKSN